MIFDYIRIIFNTDNTVSYRGENFQNGYVNIELSAEEAHKLITEREFPFEIDMFSPTSGKRFGIIRDVENNVEEGKHDTMITLCRMN